MSSVNKYNVIIAPTSATTTLYVKKVGQSLYIGNGVAEQRIVCQYPEVDLSSFRKNLVTAETVQISTLTFVGTANSTVYSATFIQYDTANATYKQPAFYRISTPVSGTVTATSIALQFKAALESDPQFKGTVSAAAGVLTVTALTGYPLYTFAPVDLGGGFTYAVTTPGVVGYGQSPYYALTNVGVAPSAITASAGGYTGYSFMCYPKLQGQNGVIDSDRIEVNMFLNSSSAQYAALVTAIDALFV